MAAPVQTWAVTAIAHPALRDVREDCQDCLALADAAVTDARITGSTGATHIVRHVDGTEHSATVARAITTLVR